jgi:hypothetical protein
MKAKREGRGKALLFNLCAMPRKKSIRKIKILGAYTEKF